MVEFAISISNIWSLTGTMSFEDGCTVNSITLEALPLIFDILAVSYTHLTLPTSG